MIRYCPNCLTERSLTEFFCGGAIENTPCNWDLSSEPIRPEGWRPPVIAAEPVPQATDLLIRLCQNGHPMEDGDIICPICGAEPAAPPIVTGCESRAIQNIAGWQIQSSLPQSDHSADNYLVKQTENEQQGTLRLFKTGFEPEPMVYEALQKLPMEHVPQVFDWGRWEGRFFCVVESFPGRTLADLGTIIGTEEGARHIVQELGEALHSLTEAGIRHRNLCPAVLKVRSEDPVDLVITDFGSARLSDFDLDIVAPLETTPYMAPEVIAGAVSPASDWWSLGMILLEQLTHGEIFKGVQERALAIQVLTNGVQIPASIPQTLQILLKGLLTKDHSTRWQWPEVQDWLAGKFVELPMEHTAGASGVLQSHSITLGGQSYTSPPTFALQAAKAELWDEACALLKSGSLGTWLHAMTALAPQNISLQEISKILSHQEQPDAPEHSEWQQDHLLMLVLKILNPAMPLVLRGDLLSPGWLLANPKEGYLLINGQIPQLLSAAMPDEANWLLRLQNREIQIRERAKALEIPLHEEALQIYSLNTSQSRLMAIWEERVQAFPTSGHRGVALLLERQKLSDIDVIILLSAELALFTPVAELTAEAAQLAKQNTVPDFSPATAEQLAPLPRAGLYAELDRRLADFAYSDNAAMDQWAQDYRLSKRLDLAKTLVLLSTPQDAWAKPPLQQYLQDLLSHFDKKIAAAGMRGPLVRMQVNERSSNIDLQDFGTDILSPATLLNHILQRVHKPLALDPECFERIQPLNGRLGRLQTRNELYQRDTGINGLYLGFPFLIYRSNQSTRHPRIMPLLLWPAKLEGAPYSKRIRLGFDMDREEVRLNPLLETILGQESCKRWQNIAQDLLARSSINLTEAMEILGKGADQTEFDLQALSPLERRVPIARQHLICSAVLFHATFAGQALCEDLRILAQTPVAPGALGTSLGLYPAPRDHGVKEDDQPGFCVTHKDPSQEIAVQKSRSAQGLLVEGPPGTGKSQTIVNMVSQALGDKRTVLIVCQKRAALEVVYKRLEAEGLAQRMVMLTDSNRERNTIIRDIRTQVDYYHGWQDHVGSNIQLERRGLLQLIQTLEQEIDTAHEALYAQDPQSGLSYQDILGRLIKLGGQTAQVQALPLRQFFESYTLPDLLKLVEETAPMATLWLDAHYEASPLQNLEIFSPDPVSLGTLSMALENLTMSEKNRLAHAASCPCNLPRQDDADIALWYGENSHTFAAMNPETLALAASWLPLFKVLHQSTPVLAGEKILAQLEKMAEDCAHLPLAEYSALLSPKLAGLPAGRVAQLHRDSSPSPLPFWLKYTPWRIIGRSRLVSLLCEAGMGDPTPEAKAALHAACKLEMQLRPLRQQLQLIHGKLGLPAILQAECLRLPALVQQTLKNMRNLQKPLQSLCNLPGHALLEDALLQADPTIFQKTLGLFQAAATRHEHCLQSLAALETLRSWIIPAKLEEMRCAILDGQSLVNFMQNLQDHIVHVHDFMDFKKRSALLSQAAMQVFAIMRQQEAALAAIARPQLEQAFRAILQSEALLGWKERLEAKTPLLGMKGTELLSKTERLQEADQKLARVNQALLANGVDASKLGSRSNWENITRLTGKRAKRLREFVSAGAEIGLLELRPIWLVNPDTASRILPLSPNLFDLVIYDEASQMPVEYAVPSLYRAVGAVVSGDEKQMPPSSFFSAQVTDNEEDPVAELDEDSLEELETAKEIKDCSDLLQLGRRLLPRTTLQIHYRSIYRELISFSNAAFYENKLFVPAKHPVARVLQAKPLRYIAVDGIYQDQSNPEEARTVVELLQEIWLGPEPVPTVGVVTFNQKQATLIEDLLTEKILDNPELSHAYHREMSRTENGENMSFFIKNVENVQGDERDVVIFSSTFGRDADGRFVRKFGILGHKGGERRLNVAITRARKQVILVNSMPIKDISDMLTTQRLPMVPRDYLQVYWAYAEAMSQGHLAAAENILERITPRQHRNGNGINPQSRDKTGIYNAVFNSLKKNGWKVTVAEGQSVFSLSFLLEDERSNTFFMGVECDAPHHPLLARARYREIWRSNVLKRGVPYIHRVSSKAWLENPEHEEQRLLDAAKQSYIQNRSDL